MALSAALGVSPTVPVAATAASSQTAEAVTLYLPAITIREYVESEFADAPIMSAISKCESHYRQYSTDGSVYRGRVNNKDVGVMQINEYYHAEAAKKLGFNLHTVSGNVAYARYLYEKEGTQPWASSAPCWSKSRAAKMLVANN